MLEIDVHYLVHNDQKGSEKSIYESKLPFVYRLQRIFFALSISIGAISILIAAFTNPPYYDSSPGIATAVATNASDSNVMDQTHLVAELVAAYFLPIGFLAMAWLANRRAPWLATIGAFLSLLGFLPLALYLGQDSLYYDIARLGGSSQFVNLAQYWNTDPIMSFYGIMFGLGTVFGPTIIGFALLKSRTIPIWAAICLTISRLSALVFSFVAYDISTAIVLAGVVLLVVGSIFATLAVLKLPIVNQNTNAG